MRLPPIGERRIDHRRLGLDESDGRFLSAVCLHSGVFTRSQLERCLDCSRATAARRASKLVGAAVAKEIEIAGVGSALLAHHRGLYEDLGEANLRHSRAGSRETMLRRLLSLEYLIEHPDMPWLATEGEKVQAAAARGVPHEALPTRLYEGKDGSSTTRQFAPAKLPVAIDDEWATFVWTDDGTVASAKPLRRWAGQHGALWQALVASGLAVGVVVVCASEARQAKVEEALGRLEPPPRPQGDSREIAALRQAIIRRDYGRHGTLTPAAQELRRLIVAERVTAATDSWGAESWLAPRIQLGEASAASPSRQDPDSVGGGPAALTPARRRRRTAKDEELARRAEELLEDGALTKAQIAETLGVSRATLYRQYLPSGKSGKER